MSFLEKIYPFRNNRVEFTNRLDKSIASWTQVVQLANRPERPGFLTRCDFVGMTIQCNYMPTDLDRRRVRALLKAWSRIIPDRYLDLQLVRRIEGPRFSTMSGALAVLRANSPAGAVAFVRDELERERTGSHVVYDTFFGERLFGGYDFDTYFTTLLLWDDLHCYGLIRHLAVQEQTHHGAGGSSIHPVWQAARNWLRANQRIGVYGEYQLRVA